MASKKKLDAETDDQRFIRLMIKKIGPVDPDDVIAADPQKVRGIIKYVVKLGGKRATDGEVLQLKKDAEIFKQMRLFKLLTETLRYQAQKRMFKEFDTTNGEIFTAGKFLLHAISTLEHIIWASENPLLLSEQKDMNTSTRKPVDKRKLIADNKNT